MPAVLSELSIAEKLLIQKVSPVVPVIHLKNVFFQDITSICYEFLRLPEKDTMVKVIHSSVTKSGDIVNRAFTVSCTKVMKAL
jgi:hypothetical protein